MHLLSLRGSARMWSFHFCGKGVRVFLNFSLVGLFVQKVFWLQLNSMAHIVFLFLPLAMFLSNKAIASDCSLVKTHRDVLSCVLINHPSVLRADAERLRTEKLESKAGQRPNFEFTGKALKNLSDSSQSSGEMDVSYTFELGGKRSARIEKARFEGELGRVDLESTRSESLLRTLLALQRLKNLKMEEQLVEDGISTFEKIVKTFRLRLKLTPEQDVSMSVYQLALEDYKIRRVQLSTERSSLLKPLELETGGKIEVSDTLYPPKREYWPEIAGKEAVNFKPASIRLIETTLHIAEAEKGVAESEAWPDLKLGPDYEWSQGPSGADKNLGITLTLPLPFWNRNQGGIAVADAEAAKARLTLNLAEKELAIERAGWIVKYENGVRSMQEGISSEEMQKRHQKLKTQFTGGLVPSSLVIEANRQILEFTKSKNEQELSTLEALWNLKRLNGTLEEELK